MGHRPKVEAAKRMMARMKASGPIAVKRGDTLWMDLEGPIGEIDRRIGRGIFAADVEAVLAGNAAVKFIQVQIDSPGGHAGQAVRIHQALRKHRAHVTVTAGETCASGASVVLAAGDLRMCYRHTKLLLHAVSNDAPANAKRRWTAAEHVALAEHLRAFDKQMVDIYASAAGEGSRAHFEREIKNEAPLPVGVAIAWGLIDCLAGEEPRHAYSVQRRA
ncbi:ATP-dependent Clp protease proteolytic subunit [Mesorhizobium australicum]|uniref:ATP-dependent Clp protease proteolytic subunit n=1 Tax=Mesorhizobium australicum TaxID=536018 RepID=UPI00333A475E